jgi:osmoprotectant transport system permease protein
VSNVVHDAILWLNDPLNWQGSDGLIQLTAEHLRLAALAAGLAAVVALPLGVALGHARRGGTATVAVVNTTRALPTLALLTLFASSAIGFGNRATVIAIAVFALPPMLANAYEGVRGVDPDVRDAARGLGFPRLRLLWLVELPLALPLIAAGVRTAVVQVIATVPLAALVGGGGLGVLITRGLATQRYGQAVAVSVVVAALCLTAEGVLALAQRLLTPRSMRLAGARSSPFEGQSDKPFVGGVP